MNKNYFYIASFAFLLFIGQVSSQYHLWTFDEGTGTTSADSGTSRNHVTAFLNNAQWRDLSKVGPGAAVHITGADNSFVSFGNTYRNNDGGSGNHMRGLVDDNNGRFGNNNNNGNNSPHHDDNNGRINFPTNDDSSDDNDNNERNNFPHHGGNDGGSNFPPNDDSSDDNDNNDRNNFPHHGGNDGGSNFPTNDDSSDADDNNDRNNFPHHGGNNGGSNFPNNDDSSDDDDNNDGDNFPGGNNNNNNRNSIGQFGTQDFTVAFWFQTTDYSVALADLIGNRAASGHGNFFSVRLSSDGYVSAEVDQDAAGTNYIGVRSSQRGLNDGNWHQVVITRSGRTLTLYIDGYVSNSGTGAGVANINNGVVFKIGRSLVASNVNRFALDSVFDDVAIYNSAISAYQVKALYQGATNQ